MGKQDGFGNEETKQLHDISTRVVGRTKLSLHENVTEFEEDCSFIVTVVVSFCLPCDMASFFHFSMQDDYLMTETGHRFQIQKAEFFPQIIVHIVCCLPFQTSHVKS